MQAASRNNRWSTWESAAGGDGGAQLRANAALHFFIPSICLAAGSNSNVCRVLHLFFSYARFTLQSFWRDSNDHQSESFFSSQGHKVWGRVSNLYHCVILGQEKLAFLRKQEIIDHQGSFEAIVHFQRAINGNAGRAENSYFWARVLKSIIFTPSEPKHVQVFFRAGSGNLYVVAVELQRIL